jgi:hypothetical protein
MGTPLPGPPYWVIEELVEAKAERTRRMIEVVARKRADVCDARRIGAFLADMIEERRKERNTMPEKNKAKDTKGKTATKEAKGYKGTKELLAEVEKNLNLGKEDEGGFAPVYDPSNGEVWKFENEGDRVEGIYFSMFSHDGDFGESKCYKLYNPAEDKIYLVWSTFVLSKYLDVLPLGSYVRVEYRGKGGRAHNFLVGLNKAMTEKHSAKAKSLIEEAAAKEKESSEMPAM